MAKVTNEAFNAVQGKIANVIGSPSPSTPDLGYNLTSIGVAKNDGDKILTSDLNLVIQDLDLALTHQTGSGSGITQFSGRRIVQDEAQAISQRPAAQAAGCKLPSRRSVK